jgi:hypothetical protein
MGTDADGDPAEYDLDLKAYQTLTSAVAIDFNVRLGLNALLVMEHNITFTFQNLVTGDGGNIEVIQGASDYTISVSPTPYVLNDGSSDVKIQSGAGVKTIISYSYDGTTLMVSYTEDMGDLITEAEHALIDHTGIPGVGGGGISIFDATIGNTGEYADIVAAQTAGKYKLKAVGNITTASDTTILNNIFLDLNGFNLACSTYNFTYSAGSLNIYDSIRTGAITFAYASAKRLFVSFTNYTLHVFNIGAITNTSSADECAICTAGIFENINNIAVPNKIRCGFGYNPTKFSGTISNCRITGAGSGCINSIYANNAVIYNLKLEGSFDAGYGTLSLNACKLDGLLCNQSTAISIGGAASKIVNVIKIAAQAIQLFSSGQFTNCDFDAPLGSASVTTIYIGCNIKSAWNPTSNNTQKYKFVNCVFESTFTLSTGGATDLYEFIGCQFAGNVTLPVTRFTAGSKLIGCDIVGNLVNNANSVIISGCTVSGTLTANSDYAKYSNNIITGASTLSSGAGYNIVKDNTLTGGLTDSSGEVTNIISDNI